MGLQEDDLNPANNGSAQKFIIDMLKQNDGAAFAPTAGKDIGAAKMMIGERLPLLEGILRLNPTMRGHIDALWTRRKRSGVRRQRMQANKLRRTQVHAAMQTAEGAELAHNRLDAFLSQVCAGSGSGSVL